MKVNGNTIKPGNVIEHKNELWVATKTSHVKPGKGGAFVQTELKNVKDNNSELRALAFHLYENNGVLKREQVTDYLKNLEQNERKILRNLGVKFGRYHVFLYMLIKPEAVSLRTLLWKNFQQKNFDLRPPTFGLNFLEDNKWKNAKN